MQCERKRRRKWAKKYQFNGKALENAENMYKQLLDYAFQNLGRQVQHEIEPGMEDVERDHLILKSFLSGFFRNVALLNTSVDGKRGSYRTVGKAHFDSVTIHPSSTMANARTLPSAVVFSELVFTQKFYIRDVSAVDHLWLAQVVPNYYEKVA